MTFPRAICVAVLVVSANAVNAQPRDPFRNLFTARVLSSQTDVAAPRAILPVTQPEQKPEPPRHTGLRALVYTTAADFKAFPRRPSTWVILGIGAGAAAVAHSADDSLNSHLTGSGGFFALGQYLGNFYVQVGTATGLYVIGRYALPRPEDGGNTNKVAHLGFDLVRALAVSQALTQAMKYSIRRDRPTGECCAQHGATRTSLATRLRELFD